MCGAEESYEELDSLNESQQHIREDLDRTRDDDEEVASTFLSSAFAAL